MCLAPSDGVFGHFDLAALCGCHTLMFVLIVVVLGTLGCVWWVFGVCLHKC